MHPLVIHSYPARSYRDPDCLEDVWIRIVVILCDRAKVLGMQYTKRLLPDFLIPGARVRLDKVVEARQRKECGSNLEECYRILGCNDPRTVRLHLRRIEEAAGAAALTLAERQAAAVHLHENTHLLRPLSSLKRLSELCRREEEAQLRSGGESRHVGGLRHVLQAALWKKRRKVSMSYVCRPPPQS